MPWVSVSDNASYVRNKWNMRFRWNILFYHEMRRKVPSSCVYRASLDGRYHNVPLSPTTPKTTSAETAEDAPIDRPRRGPRVPLAFRRRRAHHRASIAFLLVLPWARRCSNELPRALFFRVRRRRRASPRAFFARTNASPRQKRRTFREKIAMRSERSIRKHRIGPPRESKRLGMNPHLDRGIVE